MRATRCAQSWGSRDGVATAPADVESLEELLSRPRAETIEALARCAGDVIILGAGGKMGPTLARLVRRAATEADSLNGGAPRSVVAVSRWSSPDAREALRDAGVETVEADLLDRAAVADLPDAPNVIYMAGQKFGTTSTPARTWAMNVIAPVYCAERYSGSRVVAFSTGNVYPLTSAGAGGSREEDALAPAGDYAASCVGRERVFEHAASRWGTQVALIRLNYAIDLRYGVLVDLALAISRGEPIDLTMGYVNVIWQGDANRIAVEALARCGTPPYAVNVTGSRPLSVRELGEGLGRRMGRTVKFSGREAPDALLSNTGRMATDFAPPEMGPEWMLDAVAEWVAAGRPLLGKPTHFEERGGRF